MVGSLNSRNFSQKFRNRKSILKIHIIAWRQDTWALMILGSCGQNTRNCKPHSLHYNETWWEASRKVISEAHNIQVSHGHRGWPLSCYHYSWLDWFQLHTYPVSDHIKQKAYVICLQIPTSQNCPSIALENPSKKICGIVLIYPINDWWAMISMTLFLLHDGDMLPCLHFGAIFQE